MKWIELVLQADDESLPHLQALKSEEQLTPSGERLGICYYCPKSDEVNAIPNVISQHVEAHGTRSPSVISLLDNNNHIDPKIFRSKPSTPLVPLTSSPLPQPTALTTSFNTNTSKIIIPNTSNIISKWNATALGVNPFGTSRQPHRKVTYIPKETMEQILLRSAAQLSKQRAENHKNAMVKQYISSAKVLNEGGLLVHQEARPPVVTLPRIGNVQQTKNNARVSNLSPYSRAPPRPLPDPHKKSRNSRISVAH